MSFSSKQYLEILFMQPDITLTQTYPYRWLCSTNGTTRSNRLNQLNQLRTEKNQRLFQIEDTLKENQRIKDVIEKFKSVLSKERNSALKRYCEATQPLAAIIQHRLRPIYGFSDLELVPSDEGEIDVSIKWDNHINKVVDVNLAPYKFLSEAQMNVVGLSLFLSSALTIVAWNVLY